LAGGRNPDADVRTSDIVPAARDREKEGWRNGKYSVREEQGREKAKGERKEERGKRNEESEGGDQ